MKPYTYIALIETANDGVITPSYGSWKASETTNWNVQNGPLGLNGNQYFTDQEKGGGYNHFEMRRAKRAYSWDNHKYGDEDIIEGQENPPLRTARLWFDQVRRR